MSTDDRYFDALEVRDAGEREAQQMAALAAQVAHAKANAPYYGETLAEFDPAAVTDRAALAKLPVTRKGDLVERGNLPFGGRLAVPMSEVSHIFMSPGPIYEPDSDQPDYWRFGRGLWASGLRPGDIVYNTFAYHLTPAAMMVERAARAIGCPVVPAGIGNTEIQMQAIADIRPQFYGGTPSFLKILLEKAEEAGMDVSSLTKAGVGGEALPPSLRKELNDRGVFVLQSYGTADLGLVAYETEAMEGLVIDEKVLVEIVRPGSGDPVPDGEVGEVVVTLLENRTYPLIRFATGDLSAVMSGASPCGRTNTRIKGWMGRADQTTKVKGMFVHPSLVNQVVARHGEILKGRLVVSSIDNVDVMTLHCEVEQQSEGLAQAITESLQTVLKLRGQVELAAPGSLANDGKVIDDVRTYE